MPCFSVSSEGKLRATIHTTVALLRMRSGISHEAGFLGNCVPHYGTIELPFIRSLVNLAALILPRLPQLIAMPTENSIPEILVLHSDKEDDDGIKADVLGVTTSTPNEPVVTMRELWSYYCEWRGGFPLPLR